MPFGNIFNHLIYKIQVPHKCLWKKTQIPGPFRKFSAAILAAKILWVRGWKIEILILGRCGIFSTIFWLASAAPTSSSSPPTCSSTQSTLVLKTPSPGQFEIFWSNLSSHLNPIFLLQFVHIHPAHPPSPFWHWKLTHPVRTSI